MTGELEVIQDTLAAHRFHDWLHGKCDCGFPWEGTAQWEAHVAAEVVLALRTWREERGWVLCENRPVKTIALDGAGWAMTNPDGTIDSGSTLPTQKLTPFWLPVDDAEVTR